MVRTPILLALSAVVALGCGQPEEHVSPDMPLARETALQFGTALANRDYAAAYAMTTTEFQDTMSLEAMRATFEASVPLDWIMGSIETVDVLEDWPDKEDGDLGIIYVSIGGDVYSEGLSVVVATRGGEPGVRQVEFGRP